MKFYGRLKEIFRKVTFKKKTNQKSNSVCVNTNTPKKTDHTEKFFNTLDNFLVDVDNDVETITMVNAEREFARKVLFQLVDIITTSEFLIAKGVELNSMRNQFVSGVNEDLCSITSRYELRNSCLGLKNILEFECSELKGLLDGNINVWFNRVSNDNPIGIKGIFDLINRGLDEKDLRHIENAKFKIKPLLHAEYVTLMLRKPTKKIIELYEAEQNSKVA